MFLLGLWAGRLRILQHPEGHGRLLKGVLCVGLVVGLAANFISMDLPSTLQILTLQGVYKVAANVFSAQPLALAYSATFALLWQMSAGQRILSRFVPMGRMALSNYLMQTIMGIVIYYGYAFGWYGRMPTLVTMLLVVPSILLFQLLVSTWWLRHFRYGPIEWIWRQATYRQYLPLRARQAIV